MSGLYFDRIPNRNSFGKYLTEIGLSGTAVEIGTHRAKWSAPFLEQWNGRRLYCIDPYCPYPGHADRSFDRFCAWSRLVPHCDRVWLVEKEDSEELADGISGDMGCPDFVYIDGDHSYAGCKRDIEIWWPRLSCVGILAGHDFTPELPGVMRAVDEFRNQHGLTLFLTGEAAYRSWYAFKRPEMQPRMDEVQQIEVEFIPDAQREAAINSPSFKAELNPPAEADK